MKKTPSGAKFSRLARDLPDHSGSLAVILNVADDAIISVDSRQSILFFNHGAEKMFGYSAQAVKGKPLDILLPVRLAGVHRVHVEAFDKSGVAARRMGEQREVLGCRKDGSEFPVEASMCKVEFQGEPVFTAILRDATERTLVDERLRASLREKQVLIDEIHHRVKNNLQVITSLLALQARTISDPAMRKKFEESRHRIHSMAILHEILHQSGSLAHINFAEYLRRLAGHLLRSYGATGKIRLRLDLDLLSVPMDSAVLCGLIVNELLSNSFKHAFPAVPGEVRIELRQKPGGVVHVLVADDGIGLPRDLDWESTSSLGLRLVRTLAQQLEAAVETDHNHGTVFSIAFRPPVPVNLK
jgi:PAS domain S-box-containing protein